MIRMRTFVLVLMVALLPLRMWAAEGMAVRMAQDQVAASVDVAGMSSMPADCPMMASAKAGSGDEAPKAVTHCMACHLCAASACLPGFASWQGPAPTEPPPSMVASFTEADSAPDLRPPIA